VTRTWAAVVATVVIAVPATSWAQHPPTPRFTREVPVSVGLGHVFVYEGSTVGEPKPMPRPPKRRSPNGAGFLSPVSRFRLISCITG
jgi:hypothetical protein